jgi:hypothetical protein
MVARRSAENQPEESQPQVQNLADMRPDPTVRKPMLQPQINDPNLIFNGQKIGEVQTGSHRDPGGWMFSPANYVFNTLGYGRLLGVSERLGAPVNEVTNVRAAVQPGTKLLFIWPAADSDPKRITVKEHHDGFAVNLREILIQTKLRVPAGYKRFFRAEYAEEGDGVVPAIKIDLGAWEEEKLQAKGTKKAAAAPSPEKAQTQE